MKRSGVVLAATGILATGTIGVATQIAPDLSEYAAYQTPEADSTRGLTVTFMGVSTLLVDDGDSAIMTDGFFSRPGLIRAFMGAKPNSAVINQALESVHVRRRLAAVIPLHSHYDHAMDAPYVALETGARLVGSMSTRNVGLGADLPEKSFRLAVIGDSISFGRFSVTLLESQHVPTGIFLFPGEIESPLTPPASLTAYRLGEVYSVLIKHNDGSILVMGSAGFNRDTLKRVKADVVYLSVAALAKQSHAYRDSLWNEVVATGARRVIAIHWDDFFRPLSKPMRPMPRLFDKFDDAIEFLRSRADSSGLDMQIARAFVKKDPFAGLPPRTP